MIRAVLVRFLLCVAFLLPAWSMSRPGGVSAQSALSSAPSPLQLYVRLESWDRQLEPLDATTLKSLANPATINVGSPGGYQPSLILTSAAGGTLVAVSERPMDAGQTEAQSIKAITVRVIDARTGARRAQYHPAVPLWISGISRDGTQLFGWRVSTDSQPQAEWDVLDTANGSVVSRLLLPSGCCQQILYDAAEHRLYAMRLPASGPSSSTATGQPVTPFLTAYDLSSGREVGQLRLDGIQAGSVTEAGTASSAPVMRTWTPGFALSPDGQQIAVLDGLTDRLELVDTQRLTLVRSMELTQPQGLLQRLGSFLGLAPLTAEAKEWLGVDLSMQYAPDGRHLYVTGREGTTGANGVWTVHGLGLRLIDSVTGQIVAQGLTNRWVGPVMSNPDSNALYADVESPMGGAPVTLDRLDPATLTVTAKRHFYDAPELYFLAHRSPVSATWLQAWPMAGHDPQRTNRSPASGPIEPHLVFERKGLYPELAGPDGTIYAGSGHGLVALTVAGKVRWTVQECCGEGPPALAPNGMLLGTGFRHGPPAGQEDTEAIGLRPNGTIAWRIQPFGVLKGAVPLVSPANLLYLPIVGPEGADAQGLNVMSSAGTLLHKLPRAYNLAVAPNGTIFALADRGLVALDPDGRVLWQQSLRDLAYGVIGPLVGQNGTIYVGDGPRIDAFSSSGRLLWHRRKADDPLALAERSDGVLLVAGRSWLDAFRRDGTHLWEAPIGSSRGGYVSDLPSLIVDGDGTAYVGSGDGIVRAISVDGQWVATFDGGGRHQHLTLGLLLDAAGRLVVAGTDGVMRVYGSP